MKILQFTPPLKSPGPEETGRSQAAGADFASVLKAASARPGTASPRGREASGSRPGPIAPAAELALSGSGPGAVISLENQRARKLPPLNDLGQAGQLLGRLDRDIRSATPETLNRLHDLEGLIYIHSKGSRP